MNTEELDKSEKRNEALVYIINFLKEHDSKYTISPLMYDSKDLDVVYSKLIELDNGMAIKSLGEIRVS